MFASPKGPLEYSMTGNIAHYSNAGGYCGSAGVTVSGRRGRATYRTGAHGSPRFKFTTTQRNVYHRAHILPGEAGADGVAKDSHQHDYAYYPSMREQMQRRRLVTRAHAGSSTLRRTKSNILSSSGRLLAQSPIRAQSHKDLSRYRKQKYSREEEQEMATTRQHYHYYGSSHLAPARVPTRDRLAQTQPLRASRRRSSNRHRSSLDKQAAAFTNAGKPVPMLRMFADNTKGPSVVSSPIVQPKSSASYTWNGAGAGYKASADSDVDWKAKKLAHTLRRVASSKKLVREELALVKSYLNYAKARKTARASALKLAEAAHRSAREGSGAKYHHYH